MKIPLSLFYIFAFSSSLVLGQSGNQLTPVWEKSYGERLLSSSDDLSYVFSDAQKNLILVGKVERDSSYGDVAVQKISPDGQLIWQFRFSSNKGENYDTPRAARLNDAGELYILGFAAIWQDFTGYGFLLKISSDGQLHQALLPYATQNRTIPDLYHALPGFVHEFWHKRLAGSTLYDKRCI